VEDDLLDPQIIAGATGGETALMVADFFVGFFVTLVFTKEKEVFMQSTDQSWKPSVNIA
jgi:hypothetical protein